DGKLWHIDLEGPRGAPVHLRARALVNAAGPWVKHFLDEQTEIKTPKRVRLVKGSHIIVPKLYDGDHAFILQNSDNRIVFVINGHAHQVVFNHPTDWRVREQAPVGLASGPGDLANVTLLRRPPGDY
ncbi:MAG: hypothetical protein B7Z49_02350, partial [Hydrogenophilales bacterium 12-63-5]